MFEEYVPMNAPRMYPDYFIKEKVRDAKLNHGVQFHLSPHYMNRVDYTDHVKQRMAQELGNHILEQGKIKFTSFDSPVMGRTMQGETITMTYDDLYALLSHFNVYVKVTQKKL